MLEVVGDWVWVTQLHYAFRKDIFLFYVMGKTLFLKKLVSYRQSPI